MNTEEVVWLGRQRSYDNLKNLIFSPMLKADSAIRYSCVHMNTPEYLDHHIYEVSMMSYMIARRLKSYGEDIDLGKVLEYALIHDLEETITGDVPRNTKYYTKECKSELDFIGSEVIRKIAESNAGFEDLVTIWSNTKSGKEGFIIKIVDMLCVVRKALIEVELYGNLEALKVTLELSEHLKKTSEEVQDHSPYGSESTKWIKSILTGASESIQRVNQQYHDRIQSYNLDKVLLVPDNSKRRLMIPEDH